VNWIGAVRTATGGLLRHKVQAVVLGMVLLVSTASATLGLTLLAANNGPFQHAFNVQDGAQLSLTVNPARADAARLAATRTLHGVTALAGPFGQATVPTQWEGQDFGQLTLVGRSSAGGPVDDVVLNAGHWLTGPGQIVLDATPGGGGPVVGSKMVVTASPRHPVTLTVVGFANSITYTADGWVAPAEVPALGAPASAQLLYRFASAGTQAQVRADLAEVTGALPPGAVTGSGSWLAAASQNTGNGVIMEPFVVAFALIGLAMAVLIVANVVSGAVAAGYYRIGVLKSIGLTPAQVVVAYLSRVGVPALAGCLLGVVAGNLLAVPVLHQSAEAYGVGSQSVPWWASVLAPAGMLILTVLAAFAPALRAGRLSATQAIAAGRAPATGRGYGAYRLAARLRLPRPVGMGLAAPFARPARTLVSLAAIAFGATAVIFAFGLSASLGRAAGIQTLSATVPVEVQQNGPDGGPGQPSSAAQAAAVDAALRAQPGEGHAVRRRNSTIAAAMLTAMMPPIQARAIHRWLPTGWPSSRPRMVSVTDVAGWLLAKPRSHRGMVQTGTKALLA
jgi:putative ABC transport system permease protein